MRDSFVKMVAPWSYMFTKGSLVELVGVSVLVQRFILKHKLRNMSGYVLAIGKTQHAPKHPAKSGRQICRKSPKPFWTKLTQK